MQDRVRHKHPEVWATGNKMIHHDNAAAHMFIKVQHFLTGNNMVSIPHPPYSPDLAVCDFFLFHDMKMNLKRSRFHTTEEIQEGTRIVLNSLKNEGFEKAFGQWQHYWDHCINSQGDFFKCDSGHYYLRLVYHFLWG